MVLLALVGFVGGTTLLSSAATASAVAAKDKTATVVKEEVRGSYGEILTTDKSHALYIDTSPPCLDGCIISWPPLLMPKGTTVPAGAPDLSTTPYGSDRLQVTYKGQPLYSYWRDTKKKILGNGCGGFYVATVTS